MDSTLPPVPATLFSLREQAPHIKDRYVRLALVTREEQLAWLPAEDDNTLVVSCDWLLWQKIVNEGGHAIHFELGLLEWDPPKTALTEIHLRANEWIYDSGEDMTVFRGVSLGKLFSPEVTFCLMNVERMITALENLIDRFGVGEILFCDYANELNVLDNNMKGLVARTVAKERRIDYKDLRPVKCGPVGHISEHPYMHGKRSLGVRLLVNAYSLALEWATYVRCLFKDSSKRVMVLINTNMSESLVGTFVNSPFTPIFRCLTVPKRISLLWRCLWAGILLASPRSRRLLPRHRDELQALKARLMIAFARRRNGKARLLDRYVQKLILDPGRLEEAAATILSIENFIDRYRPRRIVLDGVKNLVPRIYAEVGRARGAEIDYIWHSPIVPQNIKIDSLGGDPRSKPVVTRCLTWGKVNEQWLKTVEAPQPQVRVGCPLGDRYRPDREAAAKNGTRRKLNGTRALVLQYTPQWRDVAGLNTNIYEHFITIVRALQSMGFKEIRMKLHPGPGRWKKDYFEDVADTFDLDCRVFKTEPFTPLLRWADIVVGPLPSGAFFETLAAGKPYYPFLIRPHLADPSYYGEYPIFSSVEEFSQAVEKGNVPDGHALLESLYSLEEFPSPSKRFWEVMAEDFDQADSRWRS